METAPAAQQGGEAHPEVLLGAAVADGKGQSVQIGQQRAGRVGDDVAPRRDRPDPAIPSEGGRAHDVGGQLQQRVLALEAHDAVDSRVVCSAVRSYSKLGKWPPTVMWPR